MGHFNTWYVNLLQTPTFAHLGIGAALAEQQPPAVEQRCWEQWGNNKSVVAEGSCDPCPPHSQAKSEKAHRQTHQPKERQGPDLREEISHSRSTEQRRSHPCECVRDGQQLRSLLKKGWKDLQGVEHPPQQP